MAIRPALNIELYNPGASIVSRFGQVWSTETFEGATRKLHPGGLYSEMIFGTPGTKARKNMFGCIDVKLPIMHPEVYKSLTGMRAFYAEIMAGKVQARWDAKEKDFVSLTPEQAINGEGSTGMAFFLEHWKKIEFDERGSGNRAISIAMTKFYDLAMIQYLVVIPAAIRDLEIDESGRLVVDEINTHYHTILAVSKMINENAAKLDMASYDRARWRMQLAFNEIYQILFTMLDGKHGHIRGAVMSRVIHDTTRSVITAQPSTVTDLGAVEGPGLNDTSVSMYATMKSQRLVLLHALRSGFLAEVFEQDYQGARLVDPKTKKGVKVEVSRSTFDRWATTEGNEKLIDGFEPIQVRHDTIMIEQDYWLGLVWLSRPTHGKAAGFRLLHGIEELPEGFSADDCYPLTWAFLFYALMYKPSRQSPISSTRYPTAGQGSSTFAMTFLESTLTYERRVEYDDQWQPTDSVALRWPILGEPFYDAVSTNPTRLSLMQGDHDGDMITNHSVLTKEGRQDIASLMNRREHYVDYTGNCRFDFGTDTAKFVGRALSYNPFHKA